MYEMRCANKTTRECGVNQAPSPEDQAPRKLNNFAALLFVDCRRVLACMYDIYICMILLVHDDGDFQLFLLLITGMYVVD